MSGRLPPKREVAEHVIEGPVLQHQDHDMVDLLQVGPSPLALVSFHGFSFRPIVQEFNSEMKATPPEPFQRVMSDDPGALSGGIRGRTQRHRRARRGRGESPVDDRGHDLLVSSSRSAARKMTTSWERDGSSPRGRKQTGVSISGSMVSRVRRLRLYAFVCTRLRSNEAIEPAILTQLRQLRDPEELRWW